MNPETALIAEYMTLMPHSIGVMQTLATAHEMMRRNRIRHLPVLDGGQLVGMVSQRDLHLIETFPDVDPKAIAVEEAMTTEVYSVAPEARLVDVVRALFERKIGSAVVIENEKVIGIFTTIDALRVLIEIVERGD